MCAECRQQYKPIRFERIDVGLDNTDHIPTSSVETSPPVVNRAVVLALMRTAICLALATLEWADRRA